VRDVGEPRRVCCDGGSLLSERDQRQLRRAEFGRTQLDAAPPSRRPARLSSVSLRFGYADHGSESCHIARSEEAKKRPPRQLRTFA
jgi:hypothetical protein